MEISFGGNVLRVLPPYLKEFHIEDQGGVGWNPRPPASP